MITLLEQLLRTYDVVGVSIIGYMRTGKTNIANCIGNMLLEMKGKLLSCYITEDYIANLEKFIEKHGRTRYHVYLVLDDISYHDESRSKKLAHLIARIKHKFPRAPGVTVVNICHYVTSVLPFFRLTTVRILTSIMSKGEIQVARELFDLDPLWDFYSMKSYDPIKHRYYALFNVMGYHEIIKPTLCSFRYRYRYTKPMKKNSSVGTMSHSGGKSGN